jgi:type IV secretory pathway VirB4 component
MLTNNFEKIKDKKNVFVIGSLGSGKSTIISSLFYNTYAEAQKNELFKTSKALKGFTQNFA